MTKAVDMTPAERERNRERAREWRRLYPDREKASKAAYRASDPERWREQRLAAARRYNEKNREQIRAKTVEKRIALRAQVIAAYGGVCSCPGCHVHHAELLTVDHVNGGAGHRKNRRSTRDIYAQIIRAGFPDDFQLLCGSCNLAKSDKAACPLSGQEH